MSPNLWHPFWWPFISMQLFQPPVEVSLTKAHWLHSHINVSPSPTKTAPKFLEEEEDGTETEDVSKLGNITVFRLNRPWDVLERIPWLELHHDKLTGRGFPWSLLPFNQEASTWQGWGKCLLVNGSIGLLRALYDLHSAWGLDIENEPRQMLESGSYCLFSLMMKPRVSILWLSPLMWTT